MSLLNSASLVVTPNAYKEGTLYSVIPNTSLGDMTVVRATTATRVNSAGLIELVPYNLLRYSEQFDNVYWLKYRLDLGTNTQVSPSGVQNADTFTSSAGQSFVPAIATTSITFLGNTRYSYSIYAKKIGTTDSFVLAYVDNSIGYTGGKASYNLTTQSITITQSPNASVTASMQDYGNGWYRLVLSFLTIATPNYNYVAMEISSTSVTNTFAIWGAQLVEGTLPKDYLRTETRLNIPRLDYSNGSCPSLLVEPQRTNFYTYSEQLDQWLTSGTITTTANYAISPSGIQNADRVQFGTSGSLIYRSGTGLSGSNTLSVWAKATSGTSSKFRFFANGNTLLSNDLEATNEWQRFEFIYTYSAQTAGLKGASTGASDVLFWGFQHEISSYATSYIPTTTAAVTRNADAISKTGISSLIGQTEGVLYAEINALKYPIDFNNWLTITDGTNANSVGIVFETTGAATARIEVGGVIQAYITTSVDYSNFIKVAFKYKENDFAWWVNGVEVGTDLSGITFPSNTLNSLQFAYGSGSNKWAGNVKLLAVFNEALSDSELETLTT
jgi:hypothetical protein